jgi:hypothetical protein
MGAARDFRIAAKADHPVRSSEETVSFPSRHHPETKFAYQGRGPVRIRGFAMNTIVANVMKHEAARAGSPAHPFKIVAIFCGLGLLASLCMASFGFDIGTGFF